MKKIDPTLLKGEFILLLVAVLWGSCFAFQKEGMNFIGPFTLGAFRFTIGGLILIPVIFIITKFKKNKADSINRDVLKRKDLWTGAFLCAAALFAAATFQQIGLVYTTAGKAAFLTSMEIVFVELIGIIIVKKFHIKSAFGVVLAVLGMYLLCIKNGLSFQFGDILELIGALFWGIQILLIDKYVNIVDAVKFSIIQFILVGFFSAIGMFLFENPNINSIISCSIPILYTSIIEVAFCFTMQVVGQKYVPPVITAVTLSLESIFAAIFGSIILGEILSGREIQGMIIMLIAVIVIQIPYKESV